MDTETEQRFLIKDIESEQPWNAVSVLTSVILTKVVFWPLACISNIFHKTVTKQYQVCNQSFLLQTLHSIIHLIWISAAWQAGHDKCKEYMRMKDSAEESVADVVDGFLYRVGEPVSIKPYMKNNLTSTADNFTCTYANNKIVIYAES